MSSLTSNLWLYSAKAQTDAYVNALCDSNCATKLDSLDAQHTESGMQYKDIKLGKGPAPPSGFQASLLQDTVREFTHACFCQAVRFIDNQPCVRFFAGSISSAAAWSIRLNRSACTWLLVSIVQCCQSVDTEALPELSVTACYQHSYI